MTTKHVVLGSGPVGQSVVEVLKTRGEVVEVVSRTGRPRADGVPTTGGDLTDTAFARDVSQGAGVVYHCVSPAYQTWIEVFPALHTSIIDAAGRAGAILVMADNLYMYGRPGPVPMTENTPIAPVTDKARLRAAMAEEILEAHRSGRVRAVIARASDYFGPGGLTSQMGQRVFYPLLAGKKAQVLGDPDTLHSYTYLPDFARTLVNIGARSDAHGQVWHVPNAPAMTTRQFVTTIGELLGNRAELSAMPSAMLTMLAWFSPMLRAVREEIYQVESDWVVDDSKYRTAFGEGETPVEEAISATLEWFRSNPKS